MRIDHRRPHARPAVGLVALLLALLWAEPVLAQSVRAIGSTHAAYARSRIKGA